jgi:hypothetical protein
MKLFLLTFLLCATLTHIHAQKTDSAHHPTDTTSTHDFIEVDVFAHFPGGDSGWVAYVRQAMMKKAGYLNKKHAGGKLEAQFLIMTDGRVDSVSFLQQTGTVFDDVVKEVLLKSPKWSPAIYHGRPVIAYRRQRLNYEPQN